MSENQFPKDDLRTRAERIVRKKADQLSSRFSGDMDALVEELQTYQIELEVQAEDLRQAQLLAGKTLRQFQDLYDFAPVAYVGLDQDGIIREANLTATRLLETERDHLKKVPLRYFVHVEDINLFIRFIRQMVQGGMQRTIDLRLSVPSGRPVWVRMNGRFITDAPAGKSLLFTLTDITEQKQAEEGLKQLRDELSARVAARTADLDCSIRDLRIEIDHRKQVETELRRSREDLRSLSHKSLLMLENDRRAVAREIHDSLGGSLAAIKFSLEHTMARSPVNLEITAELEKAVLNIQTTIKQVKLMAAGLRPTVLDDLGLIATIKWLCRHLSEINPAISFTTNIDIDEKEIPDSRKILIFRILQETMTNAVTHSKADTVSLSLSGPDAGEEGLIKIDIRDNGNGFNPPSCESANDRLTGYGLSTIRERTELAGGSFSIDSRPGQGTRVCITLPAEIA